KGVLGPARRRHVARRCAGGPRRRSPPPGREPRLRERIVRYAGCCRSALPAACHTGAELEDRCLIRDDAAQAHFAFPEDTMIENEKAFSPHLVIVDGDLAIRSALTFSLELGGYVVDSYA